MSLSNPVSPARAASLASLAALLVLASLPTRLPAQVASESAGRAGPPTADSTTAGYGDSARQPGVDTSRTPPAADSTNRTARDSTSPASSAASVLPTPSMPVDSVLSGACSSARPGTVAPGLLLVVFRDEATAEERSAAVTEAGGASAGMAPMGGEYVRATASARDVADQLVLNPAVASVSERSCPVAGQQ